MAGEAYTKRYGGGFVDGSGGGTPVDSTFLNAVETALLRLLGEDPAQDEVGVWVPGSGRFVFQKITNAQIDAAAAIDKSKLGALNIVNADVSAGAAIAKSKLAALNIVDADVSAGAAIAKSKLAALNIVDADVSAISLSKIAANASVVTSLPGSPTNGQVVVLTDSLTAPTYAWTLVYLSGISDAHKWLCLGGSAYRVIGSSLTVPRAGFYTVKIGAPAVYTDANAAVGMTLTAGGITLTARAGAGAGGTQSAAGSLYDEGDNSSAFTASQVLTPTSLDAGFPSGRWIAVMPKRIS